MAPAIAFVIDRLLTLFYKSTCLHLHRVLERAQLLRVVRARALEVLLERVAEHLEVAHAAALLPQLAHRVVVQGDLCAQQHNNDRTVAT